MENTQMESDLLKPLLASAVRHMLTTFGGMLVAQGVMHSSDVNGFVGAGMVIAGVAWSWWQKVGQAAVADELTRLKRSATAASVAKAQAASAGSKVNA
jgi:hypothetical protein